MAKFNEIFPTGNLPIESLYIGYEAEFSSLASIARSKYRDHCFSSIVNYPAYLNVTRSEKYQEKVRKMFRQNPVVHFGATPEIFTAAALTAHLAICCELLKEMTIPTKWLNENDALVLKDFFKKHFGDLEENPDTRNFLEFNLHNIDAFRTFQILRGLGLITTEPSELKQLSMGAGSAKKDLRSIHLIPRIEAAPDDSILFNTNEAHAKNVVVIDGDPSRSEEYKKLCANKSYPIYAINNDAIEELDKLPGDLKRKNMGKRNLIVGLRIDHQMIPDVPVFFDKLAGCIDASADFVMTIGSGFDVYDFTGRTNVIRALFEYLQEVGLEPVLLKLHGDGSLEEQWNHPSFGLKSVTTFQILYCKLKRNALTKR